MRAERWVLFRSALFVQNRQFNENKQLNGRIHALEILDIATAVLEFAMLMTRQIVLAPEIAITIGLHAVDGKQLMWPRDVTLDNDAVPRDSWCQDERIDTSVQLGTAEITPAASGGRLPYCHANLFTVRVVKSSNRSFAKRAGGQIRRALRARVLLYAN